MSTDKLKTDRQIFKRSFKIFFLLGLFFPFWLQAQTADPFNEFCEKCTLPTGELGNTPYSRTELEGGSSTFPILNSAANCFNGTFKMAIHLSYDRGNSFVDPDWSYGLTFTIVDNSSGTTKMGPTTLNIEGNAARQTVEAVAIYDDGGTGNGPTTFTCAEAGNYVINIQSINGSLPQDADVKLAFKLYQVNQDVVVPGQVSFTGINKESVNGEDFYNASISWGPVSGAVEYDLEWIYIDEFDQFTYNGNESPFLFKEPVRVTLPQQASNVYKLPLTYPKGLIYFRIRAVGRGGTIGQQRMPGVWGYVFNGNPAGVVIGVTEKFEGDKNWQYVNTYAEEGKYKKVVSFYDASLRNRQTLTNLSTDQNTLVATTKYDYEGRAVLNMLPVPKSGISLQYKENFFRFLPAGKDPKVLYDNRDLSFTSPELQELEGGKYYSSTNTFPDMDYVPDAEGYAYTQMTYTNDNTGRIRQQSGVGKTFRLKEGSDQKGKITGYFYGNATSTELYRLFGRNVGNASHYQKNLVVDPNGQVSVSYMDQEGRVIATALTGEAPDNLEQLTTNTTSSLTVDLSDNAGDYDPVDNTLTTVNEILNVTQGISYTINYNLDAATIGNLLPDCANGLYEVTITVTDPNGLEEVTQQGSTTCTGGDISLNFDFTADDVGNYTLTKVVRLAGEQFEKISEQAVTNTATELGYNLTDPSSMDTYIDDYVAENKDRCLIVTEPDDPGALLDAVITEVTDTECGLLLDELESITMTVLEKYIQSNTYQDRLNMVSSILADVSAPNIPGYVNDQADRDAINDAADCYGHCLANKESRMFDRQMTAIGTYTEAVQKGYANPLGVAWPGAPLASSQEEDPYFFNGGPGVGSGLSGMIMALQDIEYFDNNGLLQNFGTIYEAINDPNLYEDRAITDEKKWALFLSFYNSAKEDNKVASPCETDPGLPSNSAELEFWTDNNDFSGFDYGFDPLTGPGEGDSYLINAQIEMLETLCNTTFERSSKFGNSDYMQIYNDLVTYFNKFDGPLDGEVGNFLGMIVKEHINSADHTELASINSKLAALGLDCTLEDIAVEIACVQTETRTIFEERYPSNPVARFMAAPQQEDTVITFNGTDQYAEVPNVSDILLLGINSFTLEATIRANSTGTGTYPIISKYDAVNQIGYEMGLNAGGNFFLNMNGTVFTASSTDLKDDQCHHVSVVVNRGIGNAYFYIDGVQVSAQLLGGLASADVGNTENLFIGKDGTPDFFKGVIQNVRIWRRALDSDEVAYYEEVILDAEAHNFLMGYWVMQAGYATGSTLTNSSKFNTFGQDATFKCNGTACTPNWGTSICPIAYQEITETFCARYGLVDMGEMYSLDQWVSLYKEQCEADLAEEAKQLLIEQFGAKLIEKTAELIESVYAEAFNGTFDESYTYNFNSSEYHYTLYYYDQAGNLVQTVPPEGVAFLDAADIASLENNPGQDIFPAHRMETTYEYNSIEQLREQTMPDHMDPTEFWYDEKGQLRLSQNAKQRAASTHGHYSYTKYDGQGRIIEVGQLEASASIGNADDLVEDATFPVFDFEDNTNNAGLNYILTEVTRTYYDALDTEGPVAFSVDAMSGEVSGFKPTNLRGRVVAVETLNDINSTETQRGGATIYAYDPHGNVASLLQIVPELTGPKRTDYCYDLVSGNVNFVYYQPDETDQFIHHYLYDADNRIIGVQTSTDGYLWEEEAQYTYYPHGPLQRMTLGAPETSNEKKKLQGMDYYYTLQGWIKGVNMPGRDASLDPGGDDGLGNHYPKDAYSYMLGYYEDDYKPIGNAVDLGAGEDNKNIWARHTSNINPGIAAPGLFNGNISWMLTEIPEIEAKFGDGTTPENIATQGMLYAYDQLNRIKKARSLPVYDPTTGWATRNTSGAEAFDADYTYDANGNLETLKRYNNDAVLTEDFEYFYNEQANEKTDNKLLWVDNSGVMGEETQLPTLEEMVYTSSPIPAEQAYNYVLIIAKDAAEVAAGETVTMSATERIELLPDFKAEAAPGSSFTAKIGTLTSEAQDLDQIAGNYEYDEIGNLIKDKAEGIGMGTGIIDWTVYGKVAKVTKDNGATTEYRYDAAGNRVLKKVDLGTGTAQLTHYVRDASGNIMGIYRDQVVEERPIYGSGRLGQYKGVTGYGQQVWGNRQYELSNHLGNVLAVIDDYRKEVDTNGDGDMDILEARVISATDYHPFGKAMPGRTFSTDTYRYAFNGKENDKDFGNQQIVQDYGFRIYNPAIGKFLSVDPLAREYPWNSTYAFAENTPIQATDLDGLEKRISTVGIFSAEAGLINGSDHSVASATQKAIWTGPDPGTFEVTGSGFQYQMRQFEGYLNHSAPNIITIPLSIAYSIPNEAAKVFTFESLSGKPVNSDDEYTGALFNTGLNIFAGVKAFQAIRGSQSLTKGRNLYDPFNQKITNPVTGEVNIPGDLSIPSEFQRTASMFGVPKSKLKGDRLIFGNDKATIWGANFKKVPGVLDVHVHGSPSGSLAYYLDGRSYEMTVEGLSGYINSAPHTKVRLLSCFGCSVGQKLSNLTGKSILAADDLIHVRKTGQLSTPGNLWEFKPDFK